MVGAIAETYVHPQKSGCNCFPSYFLSFPCLTCVKAGNSKQLYAGPFPEMFVIPFLLLFKDVSFFFLPLYVRPCRAAPTSSYRCSEEEEARPVFYSSPHSSTMVQYRHKSCCYRKGNRRERWVFFSSHPAAAAFVQQFGVLEPFPSLAFVAVLCDLVQSKKCSKLRFKSSSSFFSSPLLLEIWFGSFLLSFPSHFLHAARIAGERGRGKKGFKGIFYVLYFLSHLFPLL